MLVLAHDPAWLRAEARRERDLARRLAEQAGEAGCRALELEQRASMEAERLADLGRARAHLGRTVMEREDRSDQQARGGR